jgi:hypothetical protein
LLTPRVRGAQAQSQLHDDLAVRPAAVRPCSSGGAVVLANVPRFLTAHAG